MLNTGFVCEAVWFIIELLFWSVKLSSEWLKPVKKIREESSGSIWERSTWRVQTSTKAGHWCTNIFQMVFRITIKIQSSVLCPNTQVVSTVSSKSVQYFSSYFRTETNRQTDKRQWQHYLLGGGNERLSWLQGCHPSAATTARVALQRAHAVYQMLCSLGNNAHSLFPGLPSRTFDHSSGTEIWWGKTITVGWLPL